MKKRLLSAFLALTMVATMVVFPVSAEEEAVQNNVTAVTEQCPCGCGPISQVEWKPYNLNDTGASAMGHYYLAGNYAQKGQMTVISGSDLVIDLRGHTLTTAEYSRLFLVEGYLAVLDTVGGGRFQSKTGYNAYGGVVMIRENETKGSAFELYSGTITVDPDNKSSLSGGLVYVSGDKSVFRMYDGVLRDGTTAKKEGVSYYGGAVAVATLTAGVEILGGTILDCSSADAGGAIYSCGTTKLENCRIINCTSTKAGGAVYQIGGTLSMNNAQIMSCESTTSAGGAIYSTGTATIENSRILQCVAATNGGNIYQTGKSLTMKNNEIAYGTAKSDAGGNLYLTGSMVFTDNGSTIRDGYATGVNGNGGGNVLFGTGTHTLTGTTIKGGVTGKYGANILNWATTTTRFIDCNIDGDVRWSGAGLSLEGQTKIGLRGNGLNLVGGNAGSVVSASKLTDGAEIFVSARFGAFTNDDANLDYFKPALRTVLTKEEDGKLSGSFAEDGAQGGYCPHCYDPENPQKVTWKSYTSKVDAEFTESGHYYLSAACSARFNIAAGADVVIDLNGLNITSAHRCFVLKKGATLSILDFNGAGKVTGKGGATVKDDTTTYWNGGVIYGEGICTLNIYCGTFVYSAQTDKHIAKGGIIYLPSGSNVNIYGGNFDATSYNKTGSGNIGAAICMDDNDTAKTSTFTMTAGRVTGGTAYRSGGAYLGKSTTANISGGVFIGGTTSNGSGNLLSSGKGKIANCAVVDGATMETTATSDVYSGNVSVTNTNIENCYIANGKNLAVKSYGGNLYTAGKVEIKDSIILGGSASRGGNVYIAAVDAELVQINTTMLCGEAFIPEGNTSTTNGNGGNLFLNNGKITIQGGEVAFGYANNVGGNVYAHAGVADSTKYPAAADDVVVVEAYNGEATKIVGGYAKKSGGNIYSDGQLQLLSAHVGSGAAVNLGQDIYLYKSNSRTAFTLGEGVTGNISLSVGNAMLGTPVYGNPIAATTATKLNANITLENKNVPVFAHDGSLFVGSTTVVAVDGEESWYMDNAAAVAACGKDEYVKLYTGNDLVLTKDLTVDLNGQTVAVSGDYTLTGMDSTGDNYTTSVGKATFAGDLAAITYSPNNNIYLPVTKEDGVSFHRLGMAVTDIVLRPDDAGIYYQAAWECDDALKAKISEYGIVASLAGMPDADFRNDASSLAASFEGEIENGGKKAGVLVKDIMDVDNENATNTRNGEMPIYATAYITLADGSTYVSDAPGVEDDVSYSLKAFMEQLDVQIATNPTFFRRFEKRTKEFYAAWEDKGMGEWKFSRLKAPQDPREDNEYNIIMIGSSFCYYYVEELYELLVEAGYENVTVCNVYYSGCPLSSHYNWWVDNKSNYQFYEVSSAGRKQISNAASLEFCLAWNEWDVISIQGNADARTIGAEKNFEKQMTYHSALLPYLKSEFPNAKHAWHQTWTYQIGYDRNGYKVTSAEQQHNDMLEPRKYAIMLCEEYDYIRINSSEAWQVVREKYGYDTLCNRLGKGTNHEGDYYHEGDIGGAQLLNACVWFEILTGKDCTTMKYDPVYTYDGKVVENLFDADMIKSAAHEAVQAMLNGGCAINLEPMTLPAQ